MEMQSVSRGKDRYHLIRKFHPPIFWSKFRRQFFDLFDDRCFCCGKRAIWSMCDESDELNGGEWLQNQLVMDHHIPFEKGGRLVSGNIVSLCKLCNGAKAELSPEDFYTQKELDRLNPYLVVQGSIIPERHYWNYEQFEEFVRATDEARFNMLIAEGINVELARCALKYEYHRYYCGNKSRG
jgi:hypothetical protein